MADAAGERVIVGIAASDGLVAGPLVADRQAVAVDRVAGTARREGEILRAALGRAGGELAALAGRGDALAAEILEFQVALIEDDDLVGPILSAVAAGEPAGAAWRFGVVYRTWAGGRWESRERGGLRFEGDGREPRTAKVWKRGTARHGNTWRGAPLLSGTRPLRCESV